MSAPGTSPFIRKPKMFKGHMAMGSITGTGAVINVELGFTPQYVHIRNRTSRDELTWDDAMTAGHGTKRVAAGTATAITSGGISPYAGSAGSAAVGFTLGTDADINADTELLHYIAISNDA